MDLTFEQWVEIKNYMNAGVEKGVLGRGEGLLQSEFTDFWEGILWI